MKNILKFRRALIEGASLFALAACTALPGRAQLTILPLGDSITYGFLTFTPADYSSAGYRYQLYQDLGGSTTDVTFLGSNSSNGTAGQPQLPASETANEGHNGYTIEGIDAELTANNNDQTNRDGDNNGGYWLTSGSAGGTPLNPQVVLLNAGTNDATDGETSAQMDAQIVQLMNDLKTDLATTDPNAQIFVGNLTPRTDSTAEELVEQQFNAALPAEVAAEGSNFHFVDLYDAVPVSDIDDAGGGQHPDLAGYQAEGNAWYGALEEAGVVPEPSTYELLGAGLVVLAFAMRRRMVA